MLRLKANIVDQQVLGRSRALAESDARLLGDAGGRSEVDVLDDYIDHMLGYIEISGLRPLKLVINPGNGCAGIASEAVLANGADMGIVI